MTGRARWAVRAPVLAGVVWGAALGLVLGAVPDQRLAWVVAACLLAPAIWAGVIIDLQMPFRPRYARPTGSVSANQSAPGVVLYPLIAAPDGNIDSVVSWVQANRAVNDSRAASHVILLDIHDSVSPMDREPPLLERLRSALTLAGADDVDVLWRAPVWSESEQAWIGRERKRGKVEDFILSTRFAGPYGDLRNRYGHAQWVFVLDDGSVLRDGTITEVKTVFGGDGDGSGPGLLAPRIVPPPGHVPNRREVLLFGRPSPMPETFPATGLMARFGEEFFLGQGAIHVDRYLSSLAGRVPSERLLSHDKLEGFYLHAVGMRHGAVEDVPPNTYPVLRAARDRWVRGDTQILPWIVWGRSGELGRISPLQRWWAATDICKSLVAPGFVAATLTAAGLSGPEGVLVQAIALLLFLTPAVSSLVRLSHAFSRDSQRQAAKRGLFSAVVAVCNALDDAVVVSWACGRAVLRMATGRRLLEWRASASVRDGSVGRSVLSAFRLQLMSVALAAVFLAAAVAQGDFWLGVLAIGWIISPVLNQWLDKAAQS